MNDMAEIKDIIERDKKNFVQTIKETETRLIEEEKGLREHITVLEKRIEALNVEL